MDSLVASWDGASVVLEDGDSVELEEGDSVVLEDDWGSVVLEDVDSVVFNDSSVDSDDGGEVVTFCLPPLHAARTPHSISMASSNEILESIVFFITDPFHQREKCTFLVCKSIIPHKILYFNTKYGHENILYVTI